MGAKKKDVSQEVTILCAPQMSSGDRMGKTKWICVAGVQDNDVKSKGEALSWEKLISHMKDLGYYAKNFVSQPCRGWSSGFFESKEETQSWTSNGGAS